MTTRGRAAIGRLALLTLATACAPTAQRELGDVAADAAADSPAGSAAQDAPATPPGDAARVASTRGWQGSIEESRGVLTVRNPARPAWDGAEPAPLRFELERTFGGPAADIEAIAAALVDADGNVYLYDNRRHQLAAFGADGTERWRAGVRGEGPAQFDEVRGAAWDGDETIYLVNQGGHRLDSWHVDGRFVGSVELDTIGVGRVYMGGYLASAGLALLADDVFDSATNEYLIVDVATRPPRLTRRFKIGADPMLMMPPGVVLQLSHSFDGDRILVGNFERYLLRVYDDAGTLQRRVLRDVDYLRRPGFAARGDQYAGVALGGLGAPVVLTSGHWLVVASWPANVEDANAFAELLPAERPPIEWMSSIDLFDAEGRFLYTIETPGSPIPAIGRPIAAGTDGRLYTVAATPHPVVRRYRVDLQPPP